MSLWWAKRDQLDPEQVRLIESLSLHESHLILGPPGSGKTNVLLRRAQFARTQGLANVLVLSFTRPLTEFVKTGCYDQEQREIFPPSLVATVESWTRGLYKEHGEQVPDTSSLGFVERKQLIAKQAADFVRRGKVPRFESIFVDEAQDLLVEEVELLKAWSPTLFFVGDDRQRIHEYAQGLDSVRRLVPGVNEEILRFHYRLARELCDMADRIQTATGGLGLAATSHYSGPRPGHVEAHGPMPRNAQIAEAAARLKDQLRAYDGLIAQGDRLGVIVPGKDDRETVLNAFEADSELRGKAKVVRAREEGERDYNPALDSSTPILIITEKGCKGLEFRAGHWLFCDEHQFYRTSEMYYTIVTRPKTRLDLYFSSSLPATLARAYTPPPSMNW